MGSNADPGEVDSPGDGADPVLPALAADTFSAGSPTLLSPLIDETPNSVAPESWPRLDADS